jgi:hypothetical protein
VWNPKGVLQEYIIDFTSSNNFSNIMNMAANQTEKNKYQQLKLKVRTIKEDLKFLKNCEKNNIIPDFIEKSVHCSIQNDRTEILMKKTKKMYLKLEKSHLYKKLNIIEPQLYSLHLKLMATYNHLCSTFYKMI